MHYNQPVYRDLTIIFIKGKEKTNNLVLWRTKYAEPHSTEWLHASERAKDGSLLWRSTQMEVCYTSAQSQVQHTSHTAYFIHAQNNTQNAVSTGRKIGCARLPETAYTSNITSSCDALRKLVFSKRFIY